MYETAAGQRPDPMYGFQYVNALEGQLRASTPEHADEAAELLTTIQQLPDTVDGWQARGVQISNEADAVRIRRESILQITDHVARQPLEGFASAFYHAVDAAQQGQPEAEIMDASLVTTLFARSLNSYTRGAPGCITAAVWAADKLDNEALHAATLQSVNEEAQASLIQAAIPDSRIRNAIEQAHTVTAARQKARTGKAIVNAAKIQVHTGSYQQECDDWEDLRREAVTVLMQAPDADGFWAGYARFKEYAYINPYANPATGTFEHVGSAELFDRWRRTHIVSKEQGLASEIVERCQVFSEALSIPEGCEAVEVTHAPTMSAVFPHASDAIKALEDFFIPRDGQGRLLEGYFTHTAEENKALVDNLLQAVRTWAKSDSLHFRDPMHDGNRGGLGDLLDYRGTALNSREIEITRRQDRSIVLNQADVGLLYDTAHPTRGTKFTFGDSAEMVYRVAIPPASPTDEQVHTHSGRTASLRTIANLPAQAINRHVYNQLLAYPGETHEAHDIFEALVAPPEPYDFLRPNQIPVADPDHTVTVGLQLEYHNPNYLGYVPPDDTGRYGAVKAVVFDELPANRAEGPEITFRYKGLSDIQAGFIWARHIQSRRSK